MPCGSVQREVVGTGVAAGRHLGALHQQVVEQRGGAEAEPVRVEPVLARHLVDHHEVLDGVLAGADAAGRLHADHLAGRLAEVADGLEHHHGDREGRRRLHLAGGGLDEVRTGHHRQPAGATYVVVGLQLAGLEDDLEVGALAVRAGTGLTHRDDLVEDPLVVAGEEGATVDDHVDLVGTGLHRVAGVGELDVQCGPAAGEGGGDRGDVDAAGAEHLLRGRDHVGVDAHGRGHRAGRVGRVRVHRLGGEGADLAGGVLPLQRGQVDHPDREVDRELLGRGLDRAGAERGGTGLRADLVDTGQPVQEPAQRVVAAGDVREVLRGSGCARPLARGHGSGGGACHRSSIGLVARWTAISIRTPGEGWR